MVRLNKKELFKMLPSVDEVLSQKEIEELIEKYPRSIVLESIREVIDINRKTIVAIKTEEEAEKFSLTMEKVIEETEKKARDNYALSLKKVINGTGTVLHTNLGRSLISEKIKDEIWTAASRYSNLEYDLEKGERGSRYVHLTTMLQQLCLFLAQWLKVEKLSYQEGNLLKLVDHLEYQVLWLLVGLN